MFINCLYRLIKLDIENQNYHEMFIFLFKTAKKKDIFCLFDIMFKEIKDNFVKKRF